MRGVVSFLRDSNSVMQYWAKVLQIVMVVSGFDYEAGSQAGGGVVLDEIDYKARLCPVGRI